MKFLLVLLLSLLPLPSLCQTLAPADSTIEASRWIPYLDSLAKATESRYGLTVGLCRAISWKESKHDSTATRAEGNYTILKTRMAGIIRIRSLKFSKRHGGIPSFLTEVFQEGSSHTRFQIMGVNLRSLGVNALYLSRISDSTAFDCFGKFMAPLINRYPLYKAIGLYNGPKFPASYPREVMILMEGFK